MRINELLVESQQLDEGPFTQAVGKVGGKIAKGIANVGKDLKTGFKAGYSGEQPPADAAATTAPAATAPVKKAAPTQAAPVQKAAGGGVIDQLKKGFAQGGGEPAADTTTAAPAANPEAEKQSKIGVGQINKIIPTLRTRDLMSLQANLEKTIASKKKAAPAAPPADAAPAADPANPGLQAGGSGNTTNAPADPNAKAAPPEAGDQRWYNDRVGQWGWKSKSGGWQGDEFDTPAAKKPRATKAKAPPQADIDAERERLMGVTSDSIIRKGPVMAESFSLYRKH
jgi:hypothetical protein